MRFVDIDKPIIVTIYNDPFDDAKSERITTTIAEILENTVEVLEEDVVRCKDCKWFFPDTYSDGWCAAKAPGVSKGMCTPSGDSFCSDGERRVEG